MFKNKSLLPTPGLCTVKLCTSFSLVTSPLACFFTLNAAGAKTEAALFSAIPPLGGGGERRGWNLLFPGEAARPQARTCLRWLFSRLFPRTQAAYLFAAFSSPHYRTTKCSHKGCSSCVDLQRVLDRSDLSSPVLDHVHVHAGAAFPRPREGGFRQNCRMLGVEG